MTLLAERMLPVVELRAREPDVVSPSAASDAALLERLRAGDDGALGSLYDRFGALVFGLAKSVARDEQIAREVTQDVFTYLWEFPERADLSRGSLRSYIGVLAHRRSVDAVRRSERRQGAENRAGAIADVVAQASDVVVLTETTMAWRRDRLAELMGSLPKDQRDALRLAYFEGRTYRQVAADLDIPEGTAKSRLRLALERLREKLESEDLAAWT